MPSLPEIITGEELFRHIRELAEDLEAAVWVCLSCRGDYGEAHSGDDIRVVALTEVPDEPLMYLIALHELGHMADPRMDALTLDREAFAWRWAVEHSIVPVGRREWARITESLRSYARDGRFKQTPDFLELLKEAETNARYEAP